MARIFSSIYTSLVALSGAADNPATITASGLLTAGLYANSAASAWMITNAGGVVGAGIDLATAGTVVNAGSVAAASTAQGGVLLQAGGWVTNQSGGTISGVSGIVATSGTGIVLNDARITATGTTGSGILLETGGSVTNAASATIGGADTGVDILFGSGTLTNAGSILGTGKFGFGSFLYSGGSVTNATSGLIKGTAGGVQIQDGIGSVVNAGTIASYSNTFAAGISLSSYGGSVVNGAAGLITGYAGGVLIGGGAVAAGSATLVNYGRITGTATGTAGSYVNGGVGVRIFDMSLGVTVINALGASITGTRDGIGVSYGTATVFNAGSISATGSTWERYQNGIELLSGGSVTNASSGWITGAEDGIEVGFETGTVVNAGLIGGSNAVAGVAFVGGGTVINQAGGTISSGVGQFWGVQILGGPGTVTNAGTIEAAVDAVAFASGFSNALTVDPGAVFVGTVDGGNTIGATAASTLELAAGAGTLTGLGTQFVNFGSIVFDPGAQWVVAGNAAGLAGTISGFAAGNTIDVTGITVTGMNYDAGVLTLATPSGATTLDLPGGFTTVDFAVINTPDGAAINLDTITLHGPSSGSTIADSSGALYLQENGSAGDGTRTLPGVSVMQFADGTGIFDSTGTAEEVARLYGAALDRAPDLPGLEYWIGQIDDSNVPLATVATDFAESPEFINDYGQLGNIAFVQQLYQNVLDRPADSAGLAYWTGLLGSGASRGTVLLGFAESQEYEADTQSLSATNTIFAAGDQDNAEIYRLYEATLDRAPDPTGQAYWIAALQSGTSLPTIAAGFVASTEFQDDYGNLTPTDFVTLLYKNVLDRAPDTPGLTYWVGLLNQGASEASVVLGFSDSTEFKIDTAPATHANWVFIPG